MRTVTILSLALGGAALFLARPGDGASPAPGLAQGGGPVPELGDPRRVLSAEETERFQRGRAVFDRDFTRSDGLGTPEMNADSCRACHQDPVLGGAGGLDLNVFLYGRDNGGFGPFVNLEGGPIGSKLRAPWVPGREDHPALADVFEQRQPPALFGLGLIDSIPADEILSREDPQDLDGDGVRGVARAVDVNGVSEVGRLGWRAQIPLTRDFIHDAMAAECGMTTEPDGRGFGLAADADEVPDPELAAADFDDLLFWLEELAPPQRVNPLDPTVALGESVFAAVGCATCHVPVLQGELEPVPLYSDLLLHDVMAPGFRGIAEPGARAGLYRTPPLWGVRHTAPYLHDGRAETLHDAILAHRREAELARQAYLALTPAEQAALIAFLEDL